MHPSRHSPGVPSHTVAADEVRQARKTLILFVPLAGLLLAGLGLEFIPQWFATINDVIARAPVVRIGWADPLALVVFPLLLVILLAVVLKAIPTGQTLAPLLARCIHLLLIVGTLVLVVVLPALRFLQDDYMSSIGYSECGTLRGNPTIWFKDWVKDPVWCVPGKDLEWVRKQASTRGTG